MTTEGNPPNRTVLVLSAVGPIVELPVTALAVGSFPEVAQDAAFGSSGSQVAMAVALVAVIVAVATMWAGSRVGVGTRMAVGVTSWIAAGLVATLAVGFLVGARWVVLAVLLAHSTVALGVLGGLAVRPATRPADGSERAVSG
ncbi:hypothetical protein [Micromonospora sp. SH-82]|uniref:hypothetical protein n=1 Tax=Micromonospora sp. SH-82 TaxID=3132938 RepID=UPI003EB6D71E